MYLYLALLLVALLLLIYMLPKTERFGVGMQEDIDCLSQPLSGAKGTCTWQWQNFQSYRNLPAGYGN